MGVVTPGKAGQIAMTAFQERYGQYRQAVEAWLTARYAGNPAWGDLYEAIRYSLLSGGKRVRPVLTLAFAHLAGLDWKLAVPVGGALEFVHTASLIHDDLPCMDNDDLRRGRPTSHKVYGETMAVLAADTLMLDASRVILQAPGLTDSARVRCGVILSEAAGCDGMCAGQVLDTLHTPTTEAELTEVHHLKTGAMIAAACQLGIAAAGGTEAQLNAASRYGHEIGLAFQIRDDVLDVIGDEAELGKPIGSDSAEGKITYVDLFGVEECGRRVRACTDRAAAAAEELDDTEGFLRTFAESLVNRTK